MTTMQPSIASAISRMSENLRKNGISSHVISTMEKVPRTQFVKGIPDFAYMAGAHILPESQMLYSPLQCARLLNEARLKPGQNVLQIGIRTGGYVTALLADQLGPQGSLTVVERRYGRMSLAAQNLYEVGYNVRFEGKTHGRFGPRLGQNPAIPLIQLQMQDIIFEGFSNNAPYDAIIVTVAIKDAPSNLTKQLKVNGCIVVPSYSIEFDREHQVLMTIVATSGRLVKVSALPDSVQPFYFVHANYETPDVMPKPGRVAPEIGGDEETIIPRILPYMWDSRPRKQLWAESGGD